MPDVPMVSRSNGKDNSAARPFSDFRAESVESGKGGFEVIDSVELAARWQVPESWIRNHTRARTPKEGRIPCLRFGRYVRFEWGSPRLAAWLEKQRQ